MSGEISRKYPVISFFLILNVAYSAWITNITLNELTILRKSIYRDLICFVIRQNDDYKFCLGFTFVCTVNK